MGRLEDGHAFAVVRAWRETEAACESLDPNRANEPMDAASAAPLRCEDRSEDANQKRGSPRPEMVREADRIS